MQAGHRCLPLLLGSDFLLTEEMIFSRSMLCIFTKRCSSFSLTLPFILLISLSWFSTSRFISLNFTDNYLLLLLLRLECRLSAAFAFLGRALSLLKYSWLGSL